MLHLSNDKRIIEFITRSSPCELRGWRGRRTRCCSAPRHALLLECLPEDREKGERREEVVETKLDGSPHSAASL